MSTASFKLSDAFVAKYENVTPPFGFNGLGQLVYMRTYSRIKPNGTNERWFETVRRVVEGTYRMQERHIKSLDLGWSEKRAQKSAQEMYDRMFHMKFLPPGRGLWAMGSAITEERGIYAALNNCGFISTADIDKELAEPFTFLMDASMLGVGVGFDVLGAGKIVVNKPQPLAASVTVNKRVPCARCDASGRVEDLDVDSVDTHYKTCPACDGAGLVLRPEGLNADGVYVVGDTREGWVDSVRVLIESYFVPNRSEVLFNYQRVRGPGLPIHGFGGVSSGPEPLKQLHKNIRKVLDKLVGKPLTEEAIADVMNMIGVCVVAGNVRRTAEIMFGSPDSEEYLNLKNYRWDAEKQKYVGPNARRAEWGWTSNNSVFAELGMDYTRIAEMTRNNGEPGYMWLENARAYGRMCEPPNFKDKKAKGANPCAEQTLESGELCCLVETFPANHESFDDYKRTLKFAYLYAKTVTLGKTHWPKTNRVLLRNRRIGTSMSGIAQFEAKYGLHELKRWCEEGYAAIEYYDKVYSDWMAVPLSIKKTSIKPSGSVSLLAGATPGKHKPEYHFGIRRVRIGVHSDLVEPVKAAGYPVEPAVDDPETTLVVEVPISFDENIRTVKQTSLWEQVALAAFLQRYWADNQVSCTVSFDPKTEGQEIQRALDYFQYDLKGISFLPRLDKGAYAQMPYEEITKDEYERRVAQLKPLVINNVHEEAEQEKFCNNDVCEVSFAPKKAA